VDHTAIPRLPIFLNEIVADLRHVVSTVQSAREIGVIKKEQVINIIDSVVQKTAVSSVKDSKGNSLTKFLALLLVLGALIAGYWLLVPGSDNTSGTDDVKPIATPPPTSKRTATAIPTVTKFEGDDLPVEGMSWNDVEEFVRKLNEKEGKNNLQEI